MSLNVLRLQPVEVIDKRCNIGNTREYGVLKGGSEVSWQPFPSTSFNNSQIQITANPPSQAIIINRKIWVKFQFALAFAGPAPVLGNLVQYGSNDAPRAYPIMSVTNTAQVSVNNDQVSTNLNQYFHAFTRYDNSRKKICDYSMSPAMCDQFIRYEQGLGSTRNALGLYADSSNMSDEPRGDFAGLNVTTNTPTTSTATLEVTEPLFLSPFYFGHGDESGLIGIQNMSFTFTLGDLTRIWSHSPGGNTFTNFTVNITGASVLLNYITPNLLERIPKAISWPYYEVTPYPTTDGSALLPGVSRTLTMNSVQLKSIPRRMYIFARRRDQDLTYQTTDTYARINTATVTWNNRTGLLSTATQQDLYQMSIRNGCDLSFNQWTKFVGSVLCIEFGTDIGLAPNESPGIIGNYQLGLQINITNLDPTDSIIFSLYVVVCNEGTFNMINQSVQHMIGVLSPADVLAVTARGPSVSYEGSHNVYGGDFWGDVWSGIKDTAVGAYNFGKDVYDTGKQVYNVGKQVYDVGKDVYDVASPYLPYMMMGLGRKKKGCKRGKSKRKVMRCMKKKRRGGAVIGGALISRSALRNRLMGSGLGDEDEKYSNDEEEEVDEEIESDEEEVAGGSFDTNDDEDDDNENLTSQLLKAYSKQ